MRAGAERTNVHEYICFWMSGTGLCISGCLFHKRFQMKKCKLLVAVKHTHVYAHTHTHHMELFSVDEWSCFPAGYETICSSLLATAQGLKPERKLVVDNFSKSPLVNLQGRKTLDGKVWQRVRAALLLSSHRRMSPASSCVSEIAFYCSKDEKWPQILTHPKHGLVSEYKWDLHHSLNPSE